LTRLPSGALLAVCIMPLLCCRSGLVHRATRGRDRRTAYYSNDDPSALADQSVSLQTGSFQRPSFVRMVCMWSLVFITNSCVHELRWTCQPLGILQLGSGRDAGRLAAITLPSVKRVRLQIDIRGFVLSRSWLWGTVASMWCSRYSISCGGTEDYSRSADICIRPLS